MSQREKKRTKLEQKEEEIIECMRMGKTGSKSRKSKERESGLYVRERERERGEREREGGLRKKDVKAF